MIDKSEFNHQDITNNKEQPQDEVVSQTLEETSLNSFEQSNDLNEFPPKPLEEPSKKTLNKSLVSLALFIASFYFIFKWDFIYILALAGVLLIHELGHYVAMRAFKYKDLSIFFVPLVGAFASGSKDSISQKQNIIILLAGPIPGVIIGMVLYFMGLQNESQFLIRVSNIFIFLNLFNLLPIMPLDGGKVIKTMFFDSNEIINTVFIVLSIVGMAFISFALESYFLLIVPFFLIMQLSNQSQVKKVKMGALNAGIDLDKSYEELSDNEYWLIRDEIASHMKYFSRSISPKNYVLAPNENGIVNQVKSIIQKKPIKDLKVGGKILVTVLWLLMFILPAIIILLYYVYFGKGIQ